MSATRILALLGSTALISASAAACSGSGAAGSPGGAPDEFSSGGAPAATGRSTNDSIVTIHGTSRLRFDPATVTVHTATVTIRFSDTSSYPHDIRVPKLGVTSRTVTGDPGEDTTTLTLHFPHPGVYPFECTYHDSAGMKGAFVVKP